MPFHAGRVSFVRFSVQGKAPLAADQALLDRLSEHRFTESPIGAPDETEAGWITGEHLFDTQFSYEKNCYGDMLLVAMRLDTNKVPADVRRAYKLMNEQAAAEGNPSGFASRNQKREAADLAARQAHEDLAAGKYRRSKIVPIMWDLRRGIVYCGAAGNTVAEQLHSLFRLTFQVDLLPLTSGAVVGEVLREKGLGRDYEDIRPSPFTSPPAQARRDGDEVGQRDDLSVPVVPWAQHATDMKDFLGNELAIWLWWMIETAEGLVEVTTPGGELTIAAAMHKALDMDCAWEATGKQTLRAEAPTRLPEAGEALREGKWPRKAGLILAEADGGEGHSFELTLQFDRFIVTGAQLPMMEDAQTPREIIEYRLRHTRQLADMLDGLVATFIKLRTSSDWSGTREKLRNWIRKRGRQRQASPATEPQITAGT